MIFPESAHEYLKLHCNMEMELFYNPPEIINVQKYFESKHPENVLELGCGLGRVSVGFYNVFSNWDKTNFWLLDGDSGHTQICDINYTTNKSFYNSLKVTKDFCLVNGIVDEQIHILNAEKSCVFSGLKVKFDFVYSFLSIGFHWPISVYLEKIDSLISSGTILIFGIRPNDRPRFIQFNKSQINSIPKNIFRVLDVTYKRRHSYIVLERK